jgi:CheY-like chemotaxis protein/quercetin dioxygenase-like cupin family protein
VLASGPMPRVDHPWGSEEAWAETDRYVGRTIIVRTGASTGPLRHDGRDKTLRLVRGLLTVELDVEGAPTSRVLRPGQFIHVPARTPHRLVAVTEAEIVEVSTPDAMVGAQGPPQTPLTAALPAAPPPVPTGRASAPPLPTGRAPVPPAAVEVDDPEFIIDDPEDLGPAPAPRPPPQPASLRPGAKVVVVVEDDLQIQDILVRALGVRYTIYRADDGVQGLALLEALPPVDLVITDLMMPGMNGLDLLRHLKADPVRKGVPVIILTARAASGDVASAINAGARSYLTKPFKLKELLAQVEKVVGVR